MSHPATLIALSLTAAYLLLLIECFLPTSGILAILSFAFLIAAVTGFSACNSRYFRDPDYPRFDPTSHSTAHQTVAVNKHRTKILNIPQSGRDRKKIPPNFETVQPLQILINKGFRSRICNPMGLRILVMEESVVTQGEFIESGRTIRVLENRMGRIYVTLISILKLCSYRFHRKDSAGRDFLCQRALLSCCTHSINRDSGCSNRV